VQDVPLAPALFLGTTKYVSDHQLLYCHVNKQPVPYNRLDSHLRLEHRLDIRLHRPLVGHCATLDAIADPEDILPRADHSPVLPILHLQPGAYSCNHYQCLITNRDVIKSPFEHGPRDLPLCLPNELSNGSQFRAGNPQAHERSIGLCVPVRASLQSHLNPVKRRASQSYSSLSNSLRRRKSSGWPYRMKRMLPETQKPSRVTLPPGFSIRNGLNSSQTDQLTSLPPLYGSPASIRLRTTYLDFGIV
jgi:hypothetical protein